MILTTHALVGAAFGKYIPNPILLTSILIPLHYVMDIFRHGEYLDKKSTFKNTWWKVVLDLVGGITVIFMATNFFGIKRESLFYIFLGAFISMFPDLLTVLYWKLNFKFLGKIYKLHQFVHRFPDGSDERKWNLRNAFNDILLSLIAITILIFGKI